jgi:hypothetical protein
MIKNINFFLSFIIFFFSFCFSSFSQNFNRDRYFSCSEAIHQRMPQSYDEYLNDKNKYFKFTNDIIYYDWDWKNGDFKSRATVNQEYNSDFINGTSTYKRRDNKLYYRFIRLDKYSLKIYSFDIDGKLVEKNKFKTSDLINKKNLNCSEIETKLLFRLKPRY